MSLLAFLLALPVPGAFAAPAAAGASHLHALPELHEGAADVDRDWHADAGGHLATVRWAPASRVAMTLRSGPLTFEARGRNRDGAVGPWKALLETYRDGNDSVRVVDLGGTWDGAEVRIPIADLPALTAFTI